MDKATLTRSESTGAASAHEWPDGVSDAEVSGFLAAGSPRDVIAAASCMAKAGSGVLSIVLETEGSTYAGVGDMAVFGAERQAGWLSGGCLEPELARRAAVADAAGAIHWIEVDTRDDDALLSGSALGCRGRLRIAMLPLRAMRGCEAIFDAWLQGGLGMQRLVSAEGDVVLEVGTRRATGRLPVAPITWPAPQTRWSLPLPRLPRVLILGAGPETPSLLRLLRELGWWTSIAERRARWREVCLSADAHLEDAPEAALHAVAGIDAALVMYHDFELDREALAALAERESPRFIGLLGPHRRRNDLFKLLKPAAREGLASRLRSPVGLPLGGRGPEAIALSIAAQLQAWRAAQADEA